ncbi:GNAT family N-acetyltransferase [Phaeocystidibacter marisrubri]|uniref:GNAT family N-acetyltransferase n=1 Tax=Phaeocystidibacter marisrubri TaxID=1577780 RepID=A0A6L3ZF80_9FLAO|nr:GNAT family N-acetyltransferase [Phaeocystidibacter marisrubri]KAB2815539.1 GNAT family N-acetyltransferase [Phaeocystidibacter marisrubri]GGH64420.1 hypothetical protein GCM10011318_00430 [Phaeocystidibacter marisrubri]
MNTIELNINNLKSLWKTVGMERGLSFENHALAGVYIRDESWPNRIWLKDESALENWQLAVEFMDANPGLTLTAFGEPSIEYASLRLLSTQYGMVKAIDRSPRQSELTLIRVSDDETAKEWSALFSVSFGYSISAKTVQSTRESIEYYLARVDGELVGTAVLYGTDSLVMGVHSMGVLRVFRGRGYARQIMQALFFIVKDRPQTHLVLQASEAGKPLYEKMGFHTEFIQQNYAQTAKNKNND